MYEIKRILINKKLVILLILLVIINGVTFVYENKPNDDYNSYSDNFLENYINKKNQLIKDYGNMDVKKAYSYISEEYETILSGDSMDYEIEGVSDILIHLEYLCKYNDKYQYVLNNAKKIIENTNEEDGYVINNVNKTVSDYNRVKNTEVSLENEDGATIFFNYNFADYCGIAFILAVVLVAYEERKKGIWSYVYATNKGRRHLALLKVIGFAIGALFVTVILYIENIVIIYLRYGGLGELGRAAQSNELFENLTLNISIGQLVGLMLLVKAMIILVLGLVFWMIISNLASQIPAFMIYGGIVFEQWYTFFYVSSYSKLKNLKNINIFCFLDSKEVMGTYLNINIFGYAVNRILVMVIILVIMLLALSISAVVMGERKPFQIKRGRWYILGHHKHGSLILQEAYKILISQRLWVIMILFTVVLFNIINPVKRSFSYEQGIYRQYMINMAGSVSDEKKEYLLDELEIWNQRIDECNKKMENCNEQNEADALKEQYHNLNIAKELVEKLCVDTVEMLELKDRGYNVEYVNDQGYNVLVGKQSVDENIQDGFLILAFLILTISSMISNDNQCNMTQSIRVTVNGRRKYILVKNLIAVLLISAFTIGLFVIRISKVDFEYGLTGMNASIRSLTYFRDISLDISIGTFLIMYNLIRIIAAWAVAQILMVISMKSKNNISSMTFGTMVIMVPAIMYCIGFEGMKYATVIECIAISPLLVGEKSLEITGIFAGILLVLIGMLIAMYMLYGDSFTHRRHK